MLPKNQNPDAPRRRRKQRGQALVESALTVLAFLAVTIGIMDFG
jgi:Flp pilus assembly protein TadG